MTVASDRSNQIAERPILVRIQVGNDARQYLRDVFVAAAAGPSTPFAAFRIAGGGPSINPLGSLLDEFGDQYGIDFVGEKSYRLTEQLGHFRVVGEQDSLQFASVSASRSILPQNDVAGGKSLVWFSLVEMVDRLRCDRQFRTMPDQGPVL